MIPGAIHSDPRQMAPICSHTTGDLRSIPWMPCKTSGSQAPGAEP